MHAAHGEITQWTCAAVAPLYGNTLTAFGPLGGGTLTGKYKKGVLLRSANILSVGCFRPRGPGMTGTTPLLLFCEQEH